MCFCNWKASVSASQTAVWAESWRGLSKPCGFGSHQALNRVSLYHLCLPNLCHVTWEEAEWEPSVCSHCGRYPPFRRLQWVASACSCRLKNVILKHGYTISKHTGSQRCPDYYYKFTFLCCKKPSINCFETFPTYNSTFIQFNIMSSFTCPADVFQIYWIVMTTLVHNPPMVSVEIFSLSPHVIPNSTSTSPQLYFYSHDVLIVMALIQAWMHSDVEKLNIPKSSALKKTPDRI